MATTLVVSNDFPPRIGGIEAYVAEICRLLDHDVVVLTSHGTGDRRHDAALPYPVVRHSSVLLPTPATGRLAVRLLAEHGADRVVFGAAAPLGLLAPTLRRAGAQRVLALSHGHEVWWARLPVSRAMLRRIGTGADHVGVISDYTRARIVPALTPTARTAVVALPPPVDLNRFVPAAPGEKVLGRCVAAGRLVAQKNHTTLLRAWAAMPTRVGRELVVAGDGPRRRRLGQLCTELGIDDSVRFLGAVAHTAMPALLRTGQVFALPVRTRLGGLNPEGLGLGFCEAAACGLPVLVGRSGGAPETVVDGETGYVVDPDDVSGLAARLDELLADPARAAAMGTAGRAHVHRFGSDTLSATLRQALALPSR